MDQIAKVGDARIVKVDGHNVAVQVFKQTFNKKTKTMNEPAWVDNGYYGHNLVHAAKWALFEAVPEGEPVTVALIEDAVARIVAATRKSA